ncbi:HYC_CC_PP family protein [Fulvivirga ligni]|uniref:HYC_CC_PP family protein n=1 Tax=Fulvivirga ligni TaxID=2904246 RepID=UPI001F1B9D3E|nr:hypothetical protein [Fulvivirga ligni]UII21361.1 hypothetical protein LVD16_26365 [Fulvivirga ligni]
MRKLLSIFLASLMLMASTGVTLATHYCGGHAMSSEVMLGQHELGCGMQMDMKCSASSPLETIGKPIKKCCDNEYQTVSADDSVISKVAFDGINLQFLVAFSYTHFNLQPVNADVEYPQTIDPPPLLDQDLHILNQSFLL